MGGEDRGFMESGCGKSAQSLAPHQDKQMMDGTRGSAAGQGWAAPASLGLSPSLALETLDNDRRGLSPDLGATSHGKQSNNDYLRG